MARALYRGFSTNANEGLNTKLFDVELVRQDLLNEFSTRLGERVGRPQFGSIIHDLLFDLNDPRTEGLVQADIERIINNDPRVVPLEVKVTSNLDEHTITAEITLQIVEHNMNESFAVTFGEQV